MKNLKFLVKTILILSIIVPTAISCDNEPVDLSVNSELLIEKDSELYNLFIRMTETSENPLVDIVCIRFNYSFLIFTYDENREIIDETVVTNDSHFFTFLDNLPENHSISLSYPIETVLDDGTPFSINSNEELKNAINGCAQDAIIGYCNGLFLSQQCVWKVPFIDGEDNAYASGVFSVNNNTSVSFDFQNNVYTGTWIFFFINDVLNFNINLAGNSRVAQDWNFNFNVELQEGVLILTSDTNNYTLKKYCKFMDEIEVGQQTPLGGIVAYDKEIYEKGWRYIETHTADLSSEEWGCLSADITFANSEEIGKGFLNSASIANYHLGLDDYQNNPAVCNAENNGSASALSALLFGQNEGAYYDWFLPSIEELQTLYDNLHLEGLGNFENAIYWSSTQLSESHGKALDFSTGEIVEIPKNSSNIKTRIIRYF
ncbi:MAG: hypothetical protein WDZ45_02825 [Flavobacteriaceae bacterium]